MSLIIRRAAGDEAGLLEALAGAPRAFPPPDAAYLERHRVYLALEGTRPAGFAALEDGGDHWRLAWLWVEPARRGRGVGRFLFADALRRVRQARPGPLRLESPPEAAGFFARMGCAEVDGAGRMEIAVRPGEGDESGVVLRFTPPRPGPRPDR